MKNWFLLSKFANEENNKATVDAPSSDLPKAKVEPQTVFPSKSNTPEPFSTKSVPIENNNLDNSAIDTRFQAQSILMTVDGRVQTQLLRHVFNRLSVKFLSNVKEFVDFLRWLQYRALELGNINLSQTKFWEIYQNPDAAIKLYTEMLSQNILQIHVFFSGNEPPSLKSDIKFKALQFVHLWHAGWAEDLRQKFKNDNKDLFSSRTFFVEIARAISNTNFDKLRIEMMTDDDCLEFIRNLTPTTNANVDVAARFVATNLEYWENCSPEMQKNPEVAMIAIKKATKNHPQLILNILKEEELLNSKEFCHDLLLTCGNFVMEHAKDLFATNRNLMLMALDMAERRVITIPTTWKNNLSIFLYYMNDGEIMSSAAFYFPQLLLNINPSLPEYEEIARRAIYKDSNAIRYLDHNTKNYNKIVLETILDKKDEAFVRFVLLNTPFIQSDCSIQHSLLEHFSDGLFSALSDKCRSDKKVAIEAISRYARNFDYVGSKLENDEEIFDYMLAHNLEELVSCNRFIRKIQYEESDYVDRIIDHLEKEYKSLVAINKDTGQPYIDTNSIFYKIVRDLNAKQFTLDLVKRILPRFVDTQNFLSAAKSRSLTTQSEIIEYVFNIMKQEFATGKFEALREWPRLWNLPENAIDDLVQKYSKAVNYLPTYLKNQDKYFNLLLREKQNASPQIFMPKNVGLHKFKSQTTEKIVAEIQKLTQKIQELRKSLTTQSGDQKKITQQEISSLQKQIKNLRQQTKQFSDEEVANIGEFENKIDSMLHEEDATDIYVGGEDVWPGDAGQNFAGEDEKVLLVYPSADLFGKFKDDPLVIDFLRSLPNSSHFRNLTNPIGWALVYEIPEKSAWVINQLQSDMMATLRTFAPSVSKDSLESLLENIYRNKSFAITVADIIQKNDGGDFSYLEKRIRSGTSIDSMLEIDPNAEITRENISQFLLNVQKDLKEYDRSLLNEYVPIEVEDARPAFNEVQQNYIYDKLKYLMNNWPYLVFHYVWKKAKEANIKNLYMNTSSTLVGGLGTRAREIYYEILPKNLGFEKVDEVLRHDSEETFWYRKANTVGWYKNMAVRGIG